MNVTSTVQWQPALTLPIGSTVIAQEGTTNKIHLSATYNTGYGYTITSTGSDPSEYITITGDGSLEISVTGNWTNCISIANGGVHIENMPNLTINTKTYAWTHGIITGGVLTIDNSTVVANITSSNYVFNQWRGNAEDGFIFTNGSKITTTGGTKAVRVSSSGFITFGDCEFTADGTKITDYKTDLKFSAATINVLADYTAVKAEIAKIPADLTLYTAESVQALNDAIAAVDWWKYDTEQTAVDDYATAIQAALDALVLTPPTVITPPTTPTIPAADGAATVDYSQSGDTITLTMPNPRVPARGG